MKLREWLNKCGVTNLKIKSPVLELDWNPSDSDKNAAWDLYIELLTRIATQHLPPSHGDESTALSSIHNLFPLTRDIIKCNGRKCIEFTKIAVVILNQIIRPFTAKWHKLSIEKAFEDQKSCEDFRKELEELQKFLRVYAKMLADMADVEDLTDIEE